MQPWPNIRRGALRPKPSSSGRRRHSGPQKVSRLWGGLRRRWSCCSCKDRSVKRTSIGQRGGRQEGQDQARHKIEIAPNLILNAPSAGRSKTKEAGGAKSSQGRDRLGHCYSTPAREDFVLRVERHRLTAIGRGDLAKKVVCAH